MSAPFRCSDGLFEHAWIVEEEDKNLAITEVETCAVCGGQRYTYVLNGSLHMKYARPMQRKVVR